MMFVSTMICSSRESWGMYTLATNHDGLSILDSSINVWQWPSDPNKHFKCSASKLGTFVGPNFNACLVTSLSTNLLLHVFYTYTCSSLLRAILQTLAGLPTLVRVGRFLTSQDKTCCHSPTYPWRSGDIFLSRSSEYPAFF